MNPQQLASKDFDRYPALARAFALEHLGLLKRLPIAVCPSFLGQILQLDTSFPVERESLRRQCDALLHLPADKFAYLTAPLARLSIPSNLQQSDWVQSPAAFVTGLTAWLWSSQQIDAFRKAVAGLFAAIPGVGESPHRLTIVVLGQEAPEAARPLLQKLRKHGVYLTALASREMPEDIFQAFRRHAGSSSEDYAHWYVDGGTPWTQDFASLPGAVAISYPQLDRLRRRSLARMEQVAETKNSGAEQMRDRLTSASAEDLQAQSVTGDPVLQRFYTELFTQSSGPQIFSTSFVQWTGRELARRAQPHTLLLRYAPRQRYQPFDDLLRTAEPASKDPEGSLRDAEMGAYYTWIEMNRITSSGKNTFFAWIEGTSQAVLAGGGAPAGTQCATAMSLEEALKTFG